MLKQSLAKFASQFLAALNHENGIRKGNKGASINGKGSSIDSRIIEYRKYFEQLAKLKKVLDLVKGNRDYRLTFFSSCCITKQESIYINIFYRVRTAPYKYFYKNC